MVFQAQKLIFAWTFVLKDEFEMAIKCNAAVAQFHGALSLSLLVIWLVALILLFEKLNVKMIWNEKFCEQIATKSTTTNVPYAFGTIYNCAHTIRRPIRYI